MHARTAVTWLNQLQKYVLLSTMEAEIIVAERSYKKMIWQTRICKEITAMSDVPVLNVNNLSTDKLVKN